MILSEHAVLLAIVFTDAAIIILLATTWLSSGIQPFLQTWLLAIFVSMIGTFASAAFYMSPQLWIGAISFGALTIGFGLIGLASFQFRTGRMPLTVLGPIIGVVALASSVTILAGYIGLSIIIWQSWGAACSAVAALNYWLSRAEAPVALTILAVVCLAFGLPFALSAGILILDGNMLLPRPDNWADGLSRFVVLLGKLGSGAILLTLSNWRLAQRQAQTA